MSRWIGLKDPGQAASSSNGHFRKYINPSSHLTAYLHEKAEIANIAYIHVWPEMKFTARCVSCAPIIKPEILLIVVSSNIRYCVRLISAFLAPLEDACSPSNALNARSSPVSRDCRA